MELATEGSEARRVFHGQEIGRLRKRNSRFTRCHLEQEGSLPPGLPKGEQGPADLLDHQFQRGGVVRGNGGPLLHQLAL